MNSHLISLMVFLPMFGALMQAFVPPFQGAEGRNEASQRFAHGFGRWVAIAASSLAGLCGIALVAGMHPVADLQMHEVLPWVGSYAISYEMGVDGLNALLVLLLSLLFPVLIAAEWKQKLGARGIYGLFLMLQTALYGAVCAQDFFLQFFFWAFSALPFYFLIGIWGGENREAAAFRSVITATIGNSLLFAAMLLVYYSVDPHTFSLQGLAGGKLAAKTFHFLGHEAHVSHVAFILICLGLALRIPVWPLQGWLSQVADEAPPSVVVALTAGVVPVATYLFARLVYTLFPETVAQTAHVIVAVGIISMVMGAICGLAQKGLRSLIAFLSLSQTGVILFGLGSLSAAGIVGAVYTQLAFGLGIAGLGLFSGLIEERVGHARFLSDDQTPTLGGIVGKAPAMAIIGGIIVASLLGVPGLGGFVGQSLVVIGGFAPQPVAVVVAGVVFLLAAHYLFTMYRLVFLGQQTESTKTFAELTARERAYLVPIVVALLLIGLYPKPLLDLVRPTALTLLSTVGANQ